MRVPPSSRTLLAFLLVAPELGCVAKPPEKAIVLRPIHAEHRSAPRPPPRHAPAEAKGGMTPAAATQAAPPAPAATPDEEELSPAEKEGLFREFDDYLAKSGARSGRQPQ